MATKIQLQVTNTITATDAAALVAWYLSPSGPAGGKRYYQRRDVRTGTANQVGLVDLGWAVLLAARPTYQTAVRLIDNPISIRSIPTEPLHTLTDKNRHAIADCIVTFMIRFNGQSSHIGASRATKLIHPKRRSSVPVIDNRTIYRHFMDPGWRPGNPGGSGAPRDSQDVKRCLDTIYDCVASDTNERGWIALQRDPRFVGFTRIEIFDMLWTAIERGGQATAGLWR